MGTDASQSMDIHSRRMWALFSDGFNIINNTGSRVISCEQGPGERYGGLRRDEKV